MEREITWFNSTITASIVYDYYYIDLKTHYRSRHKNTALCIKIIIVFGVFVRFLTISRIIIQYCSCSFTFLYTCPLLPRIPSPLPLPFLLLNCNRTCLWSLPKMLVDAGIFPVGWRDGGCGLRKSSGLEWGRSESGFRTWRERYDVRRRIWRLRTWGRKREGWEEMKEQGRKRRRIKRGKRMRNYMHKRMMQS